MTPPQAESFDVVIVGGTPGGVAAAVAAAKAGCRVVLLERTGHVGGLPVNGLGATDIATRGATGGFFADFVARVRQYYVEQYGPDSQQVKVSKDGHHFEPHVAGIVLDQLIASAGPKLSVRLHRQFDASPVNVSLTGGRLTEITLTDTQSRTPERYSGKVFVDATYEGDLAAAAGAPYRVGRESRQDHDEFMAGRLYKAWGSSEMELPASDGMGDNAVQAYNYRICLTDDPKLYVPIEKPEGYNRREFAGLIDDILENRFAGQIFGEMELDGIGRVTNMVALPNRKTDANNQHNAFVSTDLPEENWPWPTSGWDWRDAYAVRLREYSLGLLWTVQNDPALPADFKQRCRRWGLTQDEYQDNRHFPRQVYVREGRRIMGEYLFTAHDARPADLAKRPPIHRNSITASHYALDSHAVRKREPRRSHLDGFFSYRSMPYTVPYGVMIPQKVDGLLTPVPVSATHVGFSTMRMEPCWMALGQAAGTAAALCVAGNIMPRKLNVRSLQQELLKQNAILVYFRNSKPGDPGNPEKQLAALDSTVDVPWEI
jgi:hypothetical protein